MNFITKKWSSWCSSWLRETLAPVDILEKTPCSDLLEVNEIMITVLELYKNTTPEHISLLN